MFKECCACHEKLPVDNFYFQRGAPKGRCKPCRIKEAREWRNANRPKARRYAEDRARRLKREVCRLKNSPCTDCGKSFPGVCMEFDHTPGTKTYSISKIVQDGYSLQTIKEEMLKCDLVCILCHRSRTHKRLNRTPYMKPDRERRYQLIQSIKSNSPCSVCHQFFRAWQMDFDHRDPQQKTANISQMVAYKDIHLELELSKCDLLCAACHRLKTAASWSDGSFSK